jgi:hypothetical protein
MQWPEVIGRTAIPIVADALAAAPEHANTGCSLQHACHMHCCCVQPSVAKGMIRFIMVVASPTPSHELGGDTGSHGTVRLHAPINSSTQRCM